MSEHISLIKKGVPFWNKWRRNNVSLEPDFFGVNLSFTNLSNADLSQANLWEAKLKKSRFWGANMKNADVCYADLSGADLSEADLSGANLTEADLSWAKLHRTNLSGANLWGANLTGAEITNVNLSRANLNDARLNKARLTDVDLSNTDLTNTDFTEAVIEWIIFGDVDLSRVKGLVTVLHTGPSTVGLDTLHRSKWKIPEIFLRGVGVQENLIEYIKEYARDQVSRNTYMISFAESDRPFAEQFSSDLQSKGLRCWLFSEDMKEEGRVLKSIRLIDRILPVLSGESVGKEWMEKEIKEALKEENKNNRAILFPLDIDKRDGKTEKSFVKELKKTRKAIDFSRWEDKSAYGESLKQFLDIIGYKPPQKPSTSVPQPLKRAGQSSYPDALYTIIGKNNCPLYNLLDKFEISDNSLILPPEKPACLILVEDILDILIRYQKGNYNRYAFNCSGCTGLVRLEYQKEQKFIPDKATDKNEGDVDKIVSLLKTFSMFQSLDENNIQFLVSFLKRKDYKKGDVIIKKGEPGRNLHIIVSGMVEVLGDGGISIAFMGSGEVFGEMSLLSGNATGATIKAVEPTTILFMNGFDFRKVLNKFPSLQMYFTRLLARRLAEIHTVRAEEFMSGMVGKLSEMPPAELFQTFNINQKTGVLILELSRGKASLSFREGGLINAKYGDLKGKDAFYEMLKEKEGRFKFTPKLSPEDKDLEELGDFMWLLMEGMKEVDESNAP